MLNCVNLMLNTSHNKVDRETNNVKYYGTLKQASFSLVFARNKEHTHDWFILFRMKIKNLLSALLCERHGRLLQICRTQKLFGLAILPINLNGVKKIDIETPKKPWNVDLRVCRCYASHKEPRKVSRLTTMRQIFSESSGKVESPWKAEIYWRNRSNSRTWRSPTRK